MRLTTKTIERRIGNIRALRAEAEEERDQYQADSWDDGYCRGLAQGYGYGEDLLTDLLAVLQRQNEELDIAI